MNSSDWALQNLEPHSREITHGACTNRHDITTFFFWEGGSTSLGDLILN